MDESGPLGDPERMKLTDLSIEGATWLESQGALDSNVLSLLRPSDIETMSLCDKVILRARFPNLDPGSPSPSMSSRKSSVTAAVNMLAASSPKTADDLEVALAAGVEYVVVDLDGAALIEPTLQLADHLRDGGSFSAGDLWSGQRVETVTAFCRGDKVRVAPISGRELQAGIDPVTGLEWGKIGVGRAALASWAAASGMLSSITETEALEAFYIGGPIVGRCEEYAMANKVDLDPYKLFVAGLSRTESGGRDESRVKVDSSNPRKALHELLVVLFSEHDMRSLASEFGVDGNIPGSTASPSALAFGLVEALERHGLISGDFFASLRRRRPLRRDLVEPVMRLWSVT